MLHPLLFVMHAACFLRIFKLIPYKTFELYVNVNGKLLISKYSKKEMMP